MPVTRSQKGSQTAAAATAPSTVEGTSSGAATEESAGTTPSGTSYDTTSTAKDADRTLTGGNGPTAKKATKSTRTASVASASKRKELAVRAKLAKHQLQEAQAAAELARVELELLQLDEADEDESMISDPPDKEDDVERWVNDTTERMSGEKSTKTVKPEAPATTQDGSKKLADAIIHAVDKAVSATVPRSAMAPSYMHELPAYDGSTSEWMAFKTVYTDTAPFFSAVQNMMRLRKSIKGKARDQIKGILFSDSTPEEVMEALRRRYGRTDALVLVEMDKVRNLPKMTGGPKDVCEFACKVNDVITTVKSLKKPQYLQAPDIMRSIIEKMTEPMQYRWYDFISSKEDPDLSDMGAFLNRQADQCSQYTPLDPIPKKAAWKKETVHTAAEPKQEQCPHCEASHRLFECKKFLEAPTKERWDIALKSRLCFKCLQGRHRKLACKKPPCKVCKRWHHSLLHEDRQTEPAQKSEAAHNAVRVNATRTARAYLKMVPVEVYGPKGTARILALLDEGSTVTLLDAAVAEQLGLRGPAETLTIETVGGRLLTKKDSMKIELRLRGVHQHGRKNKAEARTIDNLRLTPQAIERARMQELKHLHGLVDQLYYEEEPPKLLIGQDNWELIVSRSTKKGKKNEPVASFTSLGWVLHGSDGSASRRVNFVTCTHISAREDRLEKLVKDHFALEALGVKPRLPSTDIEAKAMDILKKTTRRLDNGRFETGLLWKNEDEEMPDNYKAAENRLRGIEKKLDKDASLKEEYGRQVKNLLDSGYAEEAPQQSSSKRKWYLPHFAVTHPTKKKKRMVFDAAAKFGGKSLNDMLLPGPDLLQSLFGVLLRFRQHPIAVVADIKEMFLQVKIREEDRDSLRFLWRGELRTGKPKEYRMTSVIFGAACSPSTAIYVKNRNAEDYKDEYPDAVRAVVRNHYMDDYLHSLPAEDEAVKIASEVDTIHRRAGFELRGWASNRANVLRKLTGEDTNKEEIELGSKEEKTLGLRWFTEEDKLGFRTCLQNMTEVIEQERTPTKRKVTSAVMSTFDPMGLASPVLIQGKKLLQDIWRSGVGWDEEITPGEGDQWREYLRSLKLLEGLRIPRCIRHSAHEGELHIFTDASETAYACAVYWRQETNEGQFDVVLLAAKARVTPLKPISIPRLELQAALLGTRMARSVEEELDLQPARKTYWTDSSTVLSWIKSDPRTFKPFVAHRLAEIEETTKPQEWRWVPTKENPADDATRMVPQEFNDQHRWFTGPAFLRDVETAWPEPRSFKGKPTGEEKEAHTVNTVQIGDRHATPDPARFSSWTRLLRATARVIQFVELCGRQKVNLSRKQEKADPTWGRQKKKQKGRTYKLPEKEERRLRPLEEHQKKSAEKLLLRRSQEESFEEEIASLKKNASLKKSSKIKFDVALEDDLLKMKGRINAARNLKDGFKRPIVLDSKHTITRLLIAHFHKVLNHGNHATVINEIRQRFWILGLRAAVRATAHQCQWCKVHKSLPSVPPTGDLPEERLRFGEPAFTCAGVDYFGPMTVTIGRRHEKRWGALFTCLTTRAVHLELVSSLSSSSAILALRRMAARRGTPKTIFSDNGTNFVGANKELREALESLKKEEVVDEAEKMGIKWKFIAPGAPNMGGAWERLIRSIKTALEVTLREKQPKEEVLHTLLLEAEHLVNSRPLVERLQDNEEALTPNHFLIGRSSGLPRIGVFSDGDLLQRRSDWKTAQRLADHFWARWLKEYLPTLLPRRIDGTHAPRDLQVGDAIIIADSTMPRGTWPRGEVIRTFPGPDGRVRIIEVRTNGGILRRPSSKAILLVPAAARDNAPGHDVAGPDVGASHEGEDVGDRL